MKTRTRVTAVALALFMAATVIGASAFTTATLERQATIDVVSDSNGLVKLGGGTSGAFYEDSNGELTIEMDSATSTGINGVNPTAKFVFGNSSTLDGSQTDGSGYEYAFDMTVGDQMSGTTNGQMQLDYSGTPHDGDGEKNVKFDVYNETGSLQGSASDEGSSTWFTVTKDQTYYVVMTIDTGEGATTDLTKSTDLSGTLEVRVK